MSKKTHDLCFELQTSCQIAETGTRCPECQAYAALFEPSIPTDASEQALTETSTYSLPTNLADRLRAMADDFEHADSLYVSALVGEPLGTEIPEGEADNPARRAAHDALAVTFADAKRRRTMPVAVEKRLRSIPRRRAAEQLPRWLTDSRWATAACLVLTAALGFAADDASARFEKTSALVIEAPTTLLKNSHWASQKETLEQELSKVQIADVKLADGPLAEVDLPGKWISWRESAQEVLGTTAELLEERQHRLVESLATTADQSYETATVHTRTAAETLKNSKLGQWWAGLVQEGETHE